MPEHFYKIPDRILADENITYPEKILYGVVLRLSQNAEHRCFASNQYLADIMKCSKSSITKWLDSLERNGYIKRQLIYSKDKNYIEKRYITPAVVLQGGIPPFYDRCTANLQEGIPSFYEDSKINTVKEFSKRNELSTAEYSNNFFLNLAAKGSSDIF